jgi:hypothetical protein
MKTPALLSLTLLLPVLATAQLTAPFVKTTDTLIGAKASLALVAAWGDYDNDGWLDLFVTQGGVRTTDWLYHNNRDGFLIQVSLEPVTSDSSRNTWGAAWADYDNDGWLDLLVGSQDGIAPNRLYRNVGGNFKRTTEEEAGEIATDIPQTQGVSWADYDNDGRLDLFVANGKLGQSYADFLYHNEGNGRFARASDIPFLDEILNSPLGSWSDIDNDGDMDLLVTHTGGVANKLYRNEGQGKFIDISEEALGDDVGESVGAAWGDYDNDGYLDLFITNVHLTGAVINNFLYHNNGNGTFTRIKNGIITQELDHFVSGSWIDYDNDGLLDLFVTVTGQDGPASRNRLYRNAGHGAFTKVTEGTLVKDTGNFGSGAWADYNNDGFLDVFVSYGTIYTPQKSAIFRNTGNTNHWIKIKCVGTVSNRSAIGAKVRVRAKINGEDRWQMRQIVGSEGWITFNALDTVIGLGDANTIDTLRVEWPSGIVQEFHNISSKQSLTIVEQSALQIQKIDTRNLEFKVKGARQQQYRIDTSTNLLNWSKLTSLTITNADGEARFARQAETEVPHTFFRLVPE